MNKQKLMVCLLALGVAGLAQADTVFLGGDSTDVGNWDNGLPTAGTNGTMDVDGDLPTGAQNTATFAGATMTLGGGATFTAATDLACGNTDWVINNATVNLGDDLFCNNSAVTLNAGSAINANDDFEAQSSGTITVNGGTHTAGDYFGFQGAGGNTPTLNFLGGTITSVRLRFDNTANSANGVIGGSATATATGTTRAIDVDGDVNVLSTWTGSLTATFDTGTWEDVVTGSWKLDGASIDATSFANNFDVTGNTLTVIPEPGTLGLIAVFGGGVLFIRRRFMI